MFVGGVSKSSFDLALQDQGAGVCILNQEPNYDQIIFINALV